MSIVGNALIDEAFIGVGDSANHLGVYRIPVILEFFGDIGQRPKLLLGAPPKSARHLVERIF